MADWPDDAVVVRGGVFAEAVNVLGTVQKSIREGYGPVLSVFVADPALYGGVEQAIAHVCAESKLPHPQVRVTTVGRVRGAGFGLELDLSGGQAACHHHLILPDPPSILDAERVVSCFDSPISNPAKGR